MIKQNNDSQNRVDSSFVLRKEPRIASFMEGIHWFTDAIKLFTKNPLSWVSLFVLWSIVIIPCSLIPALSFILNLIWPVLLGGVMWGCYQLDRGNKFSSTYLFAGFQRLFYKLIMVGVIYSIGSIVIGLILLALMSGMGVDLEQVQATMLAFSSGDVDPVQLVKLLQVLMVILLGSLALSIPLFMAVWFAPALVIINEIPPIEAVKLSFFACLRNMVPFLSYGIISMMALIIAAIPLGLGMFIVMPIIFASIYTSYKSIFIDESDATGSVGENKPQKTTSIQL